MPNSNHSQAGDDGRVQAAQYLRMSTEHQRYSTENQAKVIAEYAIDNQISIVRTYVDEGKSGLRLANRFGLQQLIQDVDGGQADYSMVLVYDVSRWGRFQDTDESAFYEFMCRKAGVAVHYCAEIFDNDGSPISTIVKGLKRAMAGEYSRELSVKVFNGQFRIVEKGFHPGGRPGFGLRRMLVDAAGHRKRILSPGERKNIQTDRTILVPGPRHEVAIVHRIFDLGAKGYSPQKIATALNGSGVPGISGGTWKANVVWHMLGNEKYVGHNVYNRHSTKLYGSKKANPPERWARKDNAFEAVVEPALFEKAQEAMKLRAARRSAEELLNKLRLLLEEHGYLSRGLIEEAEDMPPLVTYRYKFGSLLNAYRQVGFTPRRDMSYLQVNRRLRKLEPAIVDRFIEELKKRGAMISQCEGTGVISVNNGYTVKFLIVPHRVNSSNNSRWIVRLDDKPPPSFTIVTRLDQENRSVMDYYVLPASEFKMTSLRLRERNPIHIDAYRCETLETFTSMAERVSIEETIL